MDPVAVGIMTNLLAAGLIDGPGVGRRRMQAVLRRAEFSAEIDGIETEFARALRDAIEKCDAGRETGELADVEENWDAIVERLYGAPETDDAEFSGTAGERLVFEDEADAIDRIAHAIAFVDGYDLDETSQLKRELKRAVAKAYRSATGSFGEQIVEAGLAEQFVAETAVEELVEIDRLQERLADLKKRFARPRFYDLYGGSDEDRKRSSRSIDLQRFEFVARPELEGARECERLLVLGPGGSGKSRALAELVITENRDISHIIVPGAALQSPQDLQPLQHESFEGDVLLVWDDIHAISPETGNTVFRKAIDELEDLLSPEHELHVLAAARSNEVESLPGDVWKTDSPLWSAFETVELGTLDEEGIESLFDRVLAKEGVVAAEEVRESFVEKALETDPSPFYVTSVVGTAERERLTMDDIEAVPEDALAIWEDQYAEIKAANDRHRFVLWAVKFLSETRVSYLHSLLKGIYTHVLDRDELTFEPPVEELCQRQWLIPVEDDEGAIRYTVHDVKVEAIDESIERQLRDFSTFLFEELEWYLPSDEDGAEHFLHEEFGSLFHDHSIPHSTQLAADHYKRALVLDPDCESANTRYGILLWEKFDAPEDAKDHFERVLDSNPDFAGAHYNYAILLRTEFNAPEKAKDHYEQALALDPDYARAHNNYANLLNEEFNESEKAKTHFKRALTLDPDSARAHFNYAILLSEEFNAPEKEKDHYEQALALDPDSSGAHNNYANLLYEEFNEPEKAKTHFKRALTLDSGNANIHYSYALFLSQESGTQNEVKYHYERALALDPDYAEAHVNYASLLRREFDALEKAEEHYERALALAPDLAEAHANYARLLSEGFDEPEKARPHLESALRYWRDKSAIENVLYALRRLIRVCRALNDEDAAIEYCERAIDIYDKPPLWFESSHAILTDTNPRTRYTRSLSNVLENNADLAIELFELVWEERNEHPADSDTYRMTLSAGVALAASLRLHDAPDSSHTCDELLSTIDSTQLSRPASALFEHLDTGTAQSIEPSDEATDEESTLESRAFAHFLELLDD